MKLLVSILICLVASPYSKANTVWEYVDKKLEKKEFSRWSLSSWLYDKEKFALQDQWLSMNLANDGVFFEFYLDHARSNFDVDTANNQNEKTSGHSSEIAAYLSFVGVSYRLEDYNGNYDQKETALNLRLIGSSHQSTHLIITGGQREFTGINNTELFTQSFYGGDISLYLVSFFGFDARYRVYSEADSDDGTYTMSSSRTQWGAFIDLAWARLFAYQFEENFEFTRNQTGQDDKRQTKGTAAGIRLYF